MNKPQPPSPFSRTLALLPPLLLLTGNVAEAEVYVKIEGTGSGITIPGEVKTVGFVDWIEANSLQFGVANPTTLSSGTISGSKSTASDIVLTKVLDKASPPLFLACAQGTRQQKVTLVFTKPGVDNEVVYYRITLTGVVISSLNSSGTGSGDRPTESVSLSYEKITTEYFLQDEKGNTPTTPTTQSTWNFATNSGK